MKILKIKIENFRLLKDVELMLEDGVSVIVGRNNSGKTSLTELVRRFLDEKSNKFKLEDFSLCAHECFWDAFELYNGEVKEENIRKVLPEITTKLIVDYSGDNEFGLLSDFIIDVDEECTIAQINVCYSLASGKISQLFAELKKDDKVEFFKELKERVPELFEVSIEAQDPNDASNLKKLDLAKLRSAIQFGFVNAQRALDDASNKEKAVLGKVFEKLFMAATSEEATGEDHDNAEALVAAVSGVQNQIDDSFNSQLKKLVPTFEFFGYPGLSDPDLQTETILKVEQLLSNHTTVGYKGVNGINLPESYNGLGVRNLIFILLKLFSFFKEFMNRPSSPGMHLIFIEEPEAHLHPQMQTVFIKKLEEIRELFAREYNEGKPWPAQFVVTTHSSHIANEAFFDSMRYFHAKKAVENSSIFEAEIKDLRTGLSEEEEENRTFLHKYMTLTQCDLLFADRAILIEGTTERLLLPEMIKKYDANVVDSGSKLGSQYLSILEVGGSYAHIFFNLIDFLDLPTLIITDIDTVKKVKKENKNKKIVITRPKCRVSEGEESCNSTINRWFTSEDENKPTKDDLLGKNDDEKTIGLRRLAFQIPHEKGEQCGRSFEDAFILANPEKFELDNATSLEAEEQAWNIAMSIDKTDFALEHAILKTEWDTPRYIHNGLGWLANVRSDEIESKENVLQDDVGKEVIDE